MTLPARITLTQLPLTPCLELIDGAITAPPPGLPPYPVGADPTQTYTLTLVNGVLAWVATATVPLSVSTAATGTVGAPLAITGTVFPPSDSVCVALSSSAIDRPSSGLVAASNVAGVLTASLTPAVAGIAYVWAIDSATGRVAVSGAISVQA